MNINIKKQVVLAICVIVFLVGISLLVLINLFEMQKIQNRSQDLYDNRLVALDFLIEADRDLHQSHVFLLQFLIAKENGEYNPDLLLESQSNAQQAKTRFSLFHGILVENGLQPDSRGFIQQFIDNFPRWDKASRALLYDTDNADSISAYYTSDYRDLFLITRTPLDELTMELLGESQKEDDELAALGRNSRTLSYITVAFAAVFVLILIWLIFLLLHSEKTILSQNKLLIQKEKIGLISTLTYKLSHLLNTPIGNLLIVASIIDAEREQITRAKMRECSEIIMTNIEELNQVLANMQAVGGTPRTIVLHSQTIQEFYSEFRSIHEYPEIRVILKDNSRGEVLAFDPIILMEILDKFIENVRKYADEKKVDICTSFENNLVDISIKNSGPAIADITSKLLFDPLHSADSIKSVGMGMFIAKNLAEHLLRGSLSLHVNRPDWVEFRLSFPVEMVG